MQSFTYKFENKRTPKLDYLLYSPEDPVPGKKYPLLIFLHGAGERGWEADKLVIYGPPKLISQGELKPDAFVLAPVCPSGDIWNHLTCELKELIDFVVGANPIDTDRISLTGISMGGYGTWEMGMSYPGFFSALAPICGGGISWRASLIGKTPVWAIHGEADNCVPVGNSIEMCDTLRRTGGNVELTILRYVQHNSWDFAYERTRLIEWLLASKKNS